MVVCNCLKKDIASHISGCFLIMLTMSQVMLAIEYVYLLTFEIFKGSKDMTFYYSTLNMADHTDYTFGPTFWFVTSFLSVNFLNITMLFNCSILKKELMEM
tara:strand:- start:142 stop:444 length:303 start_codon:yes stop_codon:yes gene_type:complete